MLQLGMLYALLGSIIVQDVQALPSLLHKHVEAPSTIPRRDASDWKATLSEDTRHRLQMALDHLGDLSTEGQAFRNDTIMRINIEREALDLSLIDLSQSFGMALPAARASIIMPERHEKRLDDLNKDEFEREGVYTRGGAMTGNMKRDDFNKDEFEREGVYTRGGAMTGNMKRDDFNKDEFEREGVYTRGGAMTGNDAVEKRTNDNYAALLNHDNLALGAFERINIAYRVQNKPEITSAEARNISSHSNEYISKYWGSSMKHGQFWAGDQPEGKPNFIEGGQVNGFGITQSTFHKLHCLANIRMILAWHINGHAANMTHDMNVHTIHCLEYIRWRELQNPDLNDEPIDTVNYKGMGIH